MLSNDHLCGKFANNRAQIEIFWDAIHSLANMDQAKRGFVLVAWFLSAWLNFRVILRPWQVFVWQENEFKVIRMRIAECPQCGVGNAESGMCWRNFGFRVSGFGSHY